MGPDSATVSGDVSAHSVVAHSVVDHSVSSSSALCGRTRAGVEVGRPRDRRESRQRESSRPTLPRRSIFMNVGTLHWKRSPGWLRRVCRRHTLASGRWRRWRFAARDSSASRVWDICPNLLPVSSVSIRPGYLTRAGQRPRSRATAEPELHVEFWRAIRRPCGPKAIPPAWVTALLR